MMRVHKRLLNGLIGATAVVLVSAHASSEVGVLGTTAGPRGVSTSVAGSADSSGATVSSIFARAQNAIAELGDAVRPLSHPDALASAFRSYFAFLAERPEDVKKPYLYFVDYGLPSTQPRGYVFDMRSMKVVDGPFTVAHGRGSASPAARVPSRFSNASGSNATSLGLYVAQNTYPFRGKSGGRAYQSIGLRLEGVSGGFNDNALARGVVVHGAPYVTASNAGRSEGCPAMEPARAQRLIPQIANGGLVFLFAPDDEWMTRDPWLVAAAE